MKTSLFLLLFLASLVLSCGTGPQPADTVYFMDHMDTMDAMNTMDIPMEQYVIDQQIGGTEEPEVVSDDVFDPGSISEEVYSTAKADIQALIADLNGIIRARNYNAWVLNLADSYFELISSDSFLADRTEDLYRRDQIVAQNLGRDPRMVQKRILRDPRDYFINVVVPSRSNDRVDDIDFMSLNNVKAYTVDQRGQRLVLYNLEVIDGKWKIIN